jgi:aldehyde:ferredoxin oxidoreductase
LSKGYTGKILRVDLSNGGITEEAHGDTFYRRYVGGWGMIGYHLLKELEPMTAPLGPENKLIFAAGPITGVPLPGNGRNAVGAKSPLTGGFGVGEAGGYWGAGLKHAGFDGVIVEGRSEDPVYLWLKDGEAELRDAEGLWGMYTKETQEAIRGELGDDRVRVACIGPGGENEVLYACIINDLTDAVGRSGLGAVMGSKNLKAVAVRGTGTVEVADPEKTKELTRVVTETLGARASRRQSTGGRPAYTPNGNLPIRNFQDGEFPEWADVTASGMVNLGLIKRGMHTCYGCPINCKEQPLEFDDPLAPDPDYSAPEYETAASLGPCCGVGDPKAVLKGQDKRRGDHSLRHGVLREGHHRRGGHRRPQADLRQRRGHAGGDKDDRGAQGLRRRPGRRLQEGRREDRGRRVEVRRERQGPGATDARPKAEEGPGAGLRCLAHWRRPHAQHP